MRFLKTTLLGGLLFLLPVVIAVVVLAKAFDLARTVIVAVDDGLPGTVFANPLVLNVAVVLALLLVCFMAGLFARSAVGQRIGKRIDAWLLGTLPGYSFVKGITDGLRSSEEQSRDFVPVVANFDDNSQLAFEVERTPKGKVVLYVPGCPDPWSGSVLYVPSDRVEPIGMTVSEALKNIRTLGRGSSAFADSVGNAHGSLRASDGPCPAS